jgi:TonB-dependent heme/hemoglobin receptor
MIRFRFFVSLFAGIMMAFSPSIYAQLKESKSDSISFYLPWVTVTANRYEKNIFETHIPVSMVRDEQVWHQGVANVGELLQQQAGITFSDAGTWSQKLVVRGLTDPQVLTLIDGMRLDVLRSYGNHAPLIDVDQVERVEIIRGPASILYGSDAVGGVVNFITKKPAMVATGFAIKGNAGVQYSSVNQQHSENVTLTSGWKNWAFLLGFNNRIAEDVRTPQGELINTGFRGYTVDAKIGFTPSEAHRFQIMGESNRMRDVGVPIDEYAQQAKFLKYNRDLIALSYEYRAPGNILNNAKAKLYYQTGERNFDAFIYQKPKGILFVNQTLTANRNVDNYGANFQTSLALFKQNLLTTGVDVFSEFDDSHRIADALIYNNQGAVVKDPPPDYAPPAPRANRNGIAVFLEDEFNPWQKWSFTYGTRFDYLASQANATPGTLAESNIRETDQNVSGNFGALYRLTENVRILANIGRAFKAPTLQERYFKGTAQIGYLYGNPDLNSETSLNIDGGIKWKFNRVSGEFNLFRNQIDNLIVMKPISANADTFLYDNVGEAKIFGGEFQANINITQQLFIFMNASYIYGQDTKLAEPLPKMPPLEGLLGFRFEGSSNKYWLEISGRVVDRQNQVTRNELKTPGYQLYNFSSGISLDKFLRLRSSLFLTFNVKNIFNKNYRDHLSSVTWWDAPGRNIVLGLRSNF